MLKKLSPRERIALFVETWDAVLRAAFLAVIDEIVSKITLRLIVEAMERRDLSAAMNAMNMDREAFGPFETALADAFNAGGVMAAEDMNLREPDGSRIVFRFGVRNPEAEALLREHSSSLVTRIVDEQRDNIRTALEEGLSRGDNPRTTALDIVGRVSRVNGTRQGGVIGLSAPHLATVGKARLALSSGDVAGMRAYLALERRDKRFDATIRKAIDEARPVPAEAAAKITGRLSDSYLKLRGDTIARTETLTSLNSSRNEAMRQAIASGKVDARFVTKIWRATFDRRTRDTHAGLNGKSVSFDAAFISTSGARLRYPGDPESPGSEHINCRCTIELKIDYTGQFLARRRN
jgi:hypothetical protein